MDIQKSTRKGKKYMSRTPSGKLIHWGALGMAHYRDSTPLKLYSHLDHNDKKRRDRYRARHKEIKLKDGTPAYKNKESSSWWAWHFLW